MVHADWGRITMSAVDGPTGNGPNALGWNANFLCSGLAV